jgi:hypothetical protein
VFAPRPQSRSAPDYGRSATSGLAGNRAERAARGKGDGIVPECRDDSRCRAVVALLKAEVSSGDSHEDRFTGSRAERAGRLAARGLQRGAQPLLLPYTLFILCVCERE